MLPQYVRVQAVVRLAVHGPWCSLLLLSLSLTRGAVTRLQQCAGVAAAPGAGGCAQQLALLSAYLMARSPRSLVLWVGVWVQCFRCVVMLLALCRGHVLVQTDWVDVACFHGTLHKIHLCLEDSKTLFCCEVLLQFIQFLLHLSYCVQI